MASARMRASSADTGTVGPVGDLYQPRWRPLSEASAPCEGICAWDASVVVGNAREAAFALVSPVVGWRPFVYLDWMGILEHKPAAPAISTVRVAVGTTIGGSQLLPFTEVPTAATRAEVRLPDGAPQSQPLFVTIAVVDELGSQLVVEDPRPVMWETLAPAGGRAVEARPDDWDDAWLLDRRIADASARLDSLLLQNQTGEANVTFNSSAVVAAIDVDEEEARSVQSLIDVMTSLNETDLALRGEVVLDPQLWQLDPTFVTVDRLRDSDLTIDAESITVSFEPFSGPCGEACLLSVVACLGTSRYVCDVVPARVVGQEPSTMVTAVSFNGAPLRSGVRYFATVAARSHGGFVSLASTDGLLLDLEAPQSGWVSDTMPASVSFGLSAFDGQQLQVTADSHDIDCVGVSHAANGSGISASWGGFADTASPLFEGTSIGPELVASVGFPTVVASGLEGFAWSVGTAPLADDVMAWTEAGLATSASSAAPIAAALAEGRLRVGDAVYVSVRAVDRAGHVAEASSDGVRLVCDRESTEAGSWGCAESVEHEGEGGLGWDERDFICFNSGLPERR